MVLRIWQRLDGGVVDSDPLSVCRPPHTPAGAMERAPAQVAPSHMSPGTNHLSALPVVTS